MMILRHSFPLILFNHANLPGDPAINSDFDAGGIHTLIGTWVLERSKLVINFQKVEPTFFT